MSMILNPFAVAPSQAFIFISAGAGTAIGDATAAGGLAAAFDGETDQAKADCARKSSGDKTKVYIGKTYTGTSPYIGGKVVIYGSNDTGYADGANPSITAYYYAKVGSAPASGTDGTILGQITFTDTADEHVGREILSTDLVTPWKHFWVYYDSGADTSNKNIAEEEFYQWG